MSFSNRDEQYDVVFVYSRYIEDLEELWKRAIIFHETLVGNEDYIENRIILNVDEETRLLNIAQFKDSNTDIWVDHLGSKRVPVLRMEVRKDA